MKFSLLFFMLLSVALTACQHGFKPIAQRSMYEKEGKNAALGHRRPIEEAKKGQEIYLKKDTIDIVPAESKNYTGSLLAEKSPNTYLFTTAPRGDVGDFLDVYVMVNRKEKAPAPAAPGADPQSAADKSKQIQDELIAALPSLEPGIAENKMPSSIKMKVMKKLPNGDIMVEAARASQNEWEANSLRAVGRIPFSKVQGEGEITTMDIADVHWTESLNGQLTERESLTWEDEYSMRWAGFDEARSKVAIDLENKRKDLEKVKDRLKDRIVNVGRERNKLSAEKNKVDALRKEAEDKLNEMDAKAKAQEQQIEQQKEVIKKQEKIIEEAASSQINLLPASDETKNAEDKKKAPEQQPNPQAG